MAASAFSIAMPFTNFPSMVSNPGIGASKMIAFDIAE